MNINDYHVGQLVYVERTGNLARNKTKEECISEWAITSVGRKYIKARGTEELWHEVTFEWSDIYETFVEKTHYGINYMLYKTKEDIEIKYEKEELYKKISEKFRSPSSRGITIEKLRKINEILEEE